MRPTGWTVPGAVFACGDSPHWRCTVRPAATRLPDNGELAASFRSGTPCSFLSHLLERLSWSRRPRSVWTSTEVIPLPGPNQNPRLLISWSTLAVKPWAPNLLVQGGRELGLPGEGCVPMESLYSHSSDLRNDQEGSQLQYGAPAQIYWESGLRTLEAVQIMPARAKPALTVKCA